MNILIIGNGLDLDLRLPTKYTDFLDFTNAFIFSISNNADEIDEFDTQNVYRATFSRCHKPDSVNLEKQYQKSKSTLERFEPCFSSKFINKACKDFHRCVYDNCWIKYFNERYETHLIAGENWIDLESEIQRVIDILENKGFFNIIYDRNGSNINPSSAFISDILNIKKIIDEFEGNKVTLFIEDYTKFKNRLLNDFDKFVMALGIYLDFFVSQLPLDVEHASKELIDMMTDNIPNKIERILSFNYKNNFRHKISSSQTCYVHGSINYTQELNDHISEQMSNDDKTYMSIGEIIKRNKMIIGFDSLQNNNENSDTLDFELEFVDYRKYFQRIYKGTDSLYADWLDEYKKKLKENKHIAVRLEETRESVINRLILQQAETKPNRIFVFGHSLDATDNEIFKDIFLRELNDTQITIYYHDLDSRKRIITNLIKILTKPILVQKTKGNNPDIKFVEQTYKR